MEKANIATHAGLMEAILAGKATKDSLFAYLKEAGYQGPEETMIGYLLYAFEQTNTYTTGNVSLNPRHPFKAITQDEYFKMLAERMNYLV